MFYQRNSCSLHIHDEMEMKIVWIKAPPYDSQLKQEVMILLALWKLLKLTTQFECLYLGYSSHTLSLMTIKLHVSYSKGERGLDSSHYLHVWLVQRCQQATGVTRTMFLISEQVGEIAMHAEIR